MTLNTASASISSDGVALDFGIVVIGRNEGERLRDSLSSVQATTDAPIIYVDSRSKDNSVEIARSLGIETLVLSEDKAINASRARNEGARVLMGLFPNLQFLQFLDGDTALNEDWIVTAYKHLEDNAEVAYVCGQLREKNRDENIYRRLCDMEWRWEATENADPCSLGGIGMMRVSALTESGGYDETLIAGADPELYGRLVQSGWVLHVLDSAMGIHDSGMLSFRQWWVRAMKSGFSFANGQASGAWGRELRSVVIWGGILPLIAIMAAIGMNVWFLGLLLLFPLNTFRIWVSPVKNEFSQYDRFLYAAACMGMKIPQSVGISKFYWRSYTKQTTSVIQYK